MNLNEKRRERNEKEERGWRRWSKLETRMMLASWITVGALICCESFSVGAGTNKGQKLRKSEEKKV